MDLVPAPSVEMWTRDAWKLDRTSVSDSRSHGWPQAGRWFALRPSVETRTGRSSSQRLRLLDRCSVLWATLTRSRRRFTSSQQAPEQQAQRLETSREESRINRDYRRTVQVFSRPSICGSQQYKTTHRYGRGTNTRKGVAGLAFILVIVSQQQTKNTIVTQANLMADGSLVTCRFSGPFVGLVSVPPPHMAVSSHNRSSRRGRQGLDLVSWRYSLLPQLDAHFRVVRHTVGHPIDVSSCIGSQLSRRLYLLRVYDQQAVDTGILFLFSLNHVWVWLSY